MAKVIEFPQKIKPQSETEQGANKLEGELQEEVEQRQGKPQENKLITSDERVEIHLNKLYLKILDIKKKVGDLTEQIRIVTNWRDNEMKSDHSSVVSLNRRIDELEKKIAEHESERNKINLEIQKLWNFHVKQLDRRKSEDARKRDIETINNEIDEIDNQLNYFSLIMVLTEAEKQMVENLNERKEKLIAEKVELIKWEE